jgi:hypothetical protein
MPLVWDIYHVLYSPVTSQSLNSFIASNIEYSKLMAEVLSLLMKALSVLALSLYHCGIHILWIKL